MKFGGLEVSKAQRLEELEREIVEPMLLDHRGAALVHADYLGASVAQ